MCIVGDGFELTFQLSGLCPSSSLFRVKIQHPRSGPTRTIPMSASNLMQRFMKVIKAAKRGTTGAVGSVLGGSSDSSAALKKRLKADLPEVSAHEVSRHESWYRLRGLHLAKRRAEKQVRHGRSRNKHLRRRGVKHKSKRAFPCARIGAAEHRAAWSLRLA